MLLTLIMFANTSNFTFLFSSHGTHIKQDKRIKHAHTSSPHSPITDVVGAYPSNPVVPLLLGLHITDSDVILSTDIAASNAPPAGRNENNFSSYHSSNSGTSHDQNTNDTGTWNSSICVITIRMLTGKIISLRCTHELTPASPMLMCEVLQQVCGYMNLFF